MSINSCTIDSFTIDSFCSRQRQLTIARLVPILHPPTPVTSSGGGNPRVLRDTWFDRREEEEKPVLTFEQPIVSVTVEIFGFSGTDTQDVMGSQVDFVTVTNLEVQRELEELQMSISISDLRFEILSEELKNVDCR